MFRENILSAEFFELGIYLDKQNVLPGLLDALNSWANIPLSVSM